jgi:hypothetical protein
MTIFYWKIILNSMRIKIKHLAGKEKEQLNFTPFPLSEAWHFLH